MGDINIFTITAMILVACGTVHVVLLVASYWREIGTIALGIGGMAVGAAAIFVFLIGSHYGFVFADWLDKITYGTNMYLIGGVLILVSLWCNGRKREDQ